MHRARLRRPDSQTRKFLQFYIGERDFALIPVETVAEIATVRLSEVLPVPEMRSCILGVYNWRGEMLWVVDFGELLGYPPLYGCVVAVPAVGLIFSPAVRSPKRWRLLWNGMNR